VLPEHGHDWPLIVMAGLVPAIHVFVVRNKEKTWMPGTRPGMTEKSGIRRLPVIASEAKQSISTGSKMPDGLLRRCAPRNDEHCR
jgi:hypothetical protein